MKAADIPDAAMLAVLADSPPTWLGGDAPKWWCAWHVAARFPDYPKKVVVAKVGQLIKRGLADGCTCGCRGDFELTPKGREMLGR